MAAKTSSTKPHTVHHRDGSVWAKGQTIDGVPTGYWEWFRKDGTKLRSATYNRKGQVYKVTTIRPKLSRRR